MSEIRILPPQTRPSALGQLRSSGLRPSAPLRAAIDNPESGHLSECCSMGAYEFRGACVEIASRGPRLTRLCRT